MDSSTRLLARSGRLHLYAGRGFYRSPDPATTNPHHDDESESSSESDVVWPFPREAAVGEDAGSAGGEEMALLAAGEEAPDHGSVRSSSSGLSRCSSSDSMVTDATSSDRSRGNGGDRADMVNGRRRTDRADTVTHSLGSTSGRWTDDKHRSYLTFMEENFVKEMFENGCCRPTHMAAADDATTSLQKIDELEMRTCRSMLKEPHRNIPPLNMPWPLLETLPISKVQLNSKRANVANDHHSLLVFDSGLEEIKRQECMLRTSNMYGAQDSSVCRNTSISSSCRISNAGNCGEVEDVGEKVKSSCQVLPPDTHHGARPMRPRKRRRGSNSDLPRRTSTRSKLENRSEDNSNGLNIMF